MKEGTDTDAETRALMILFARAIRSGVRERAQRARQASGSSTPSTTRSAARQREESGNENLI